MNILITILAVLVLLNNKTYSVPVDSTDYFEFTDETATLAPTTTVTTTTTTTTTTTLAPEVDREWEDLILAGPAVVNYLGLFMVLASRQDLSLTPPADYTLTHLKSTSLRAILSGILSDMQSAFKGAKEDLVRTRDSMNQIPDHIKAGLLLIQTAPIDLLTQLLPYTLRNVDRAANEGSVVTKPTLARFVSVGLSLDELATLIASTPSIAATADDLIEANAYANDLKTQWDLLVKLFRKFSERADITQGSLSNNFVDPINQAQKTSGFSSQTQRTGHLDKLIPAAIAIDQSSHLLEMMARTYTDISNEHMVNQIDSSKTYLTLQTEPERSTSQRKLWQDTIAQSVNVARRAQQRQNEFADTSSNRQTEYGAYLENVHAG